MELELKHLAAYLPYGLKCMQFVGGIDTECCLTTRNIHTHLDKKSKPILRPLSDLTRPFKEGDINYEKYYSWLSFINAGEEYLIDQDLDIEIDTEGYSSTIYFPLIKGIEIYEKLLENHFDIFGLIQAGLAIDINTLSNEK